MRSPSALSRFSIELGGVGTDEPAADVRLHDATADPLGSVVVLTSAPLLRCHVQHLEKCPTPVPVPGPGVGTGNPAASLVTSMQLLKEALKPRSKACRVRLAKPLSQRGRQAHGDRRGQIGACHTCYSATLIATAQHT